MAGGRSVIVNPAADLTADEALQSHAALEEALGTPHCTPSRVDYYRVIKGYDTARMITGLNGGKANFVDGTAGPAALARI